MATTTTTFSCAGFQQNLAAGDILYVLAQGNPRSAVTPSIGVYPGAGASVLVEICYSPVSQVVANPADPLNKWSPWDLGVITSASSKNDASFLGYFSALRVTVTGGTAIITGGL